MGKVEIFPGMANPREHELQKTTFSGDEALNFRVSSRMEILSILRAITMHGTRICIHYGDDERSVLTDMAGLDAEGLWLDANWFPQEDMPLLLDGGLTFVSMHQHVKIQFDSEQARYGRFQGRNALFLEWPDHLLRLQRREFFRSAVPPSRKARCLIPVRSGNPDEATATRATPLVDISGGGVRLLCDKNDTELLPDKTFPNCHLALPDEEPLTVTIEVRNSSGYASFNNETYKRVGCRFVDLNNHTNILLQRHITRLQGENMSRRR